MIDDENKREEQERQYTRIEDLEAKAAGAQELLISSTTKSKGLNSTPATVFTKQMGDPPPHHHHHQIRIRKRESRRRCERQPVRPPKRLTSASSRTCRMLTGAKFAEGAADPMRPIASNTKTTEQFLCSRWTTASCMPVAAPPLYQLLLPG